MKQQCTLFLILFLFNGFLSAQNVVGTITVESGFGLPGVNVTETGTTNGTISDVDGTYWRHLSTFGLHFSNTWKIN